jgi:hypothetical protein
MKSRVKNLGGGDNLTPKVRKKRFPSKGGFTRFFKNDNEQKEFESLQMQLINYLDDGTIPWGEYY